MKTPRVKRYLESFAKQVVRDSRKMLSSAKGNTALAKSIRAVVETTATGFSTKFYMADYGTFLDEGVSGTVLPLAELSIFLESLTTCFAKLSKYLLTLGVFIIQ